MRVGADQRVGEGDGFAVDRARLHDLCDVLQVDLVHDAGGGGHNPEVSEGVLPPAQELVPLAVALELALGVVHQRKGRAKLVHLHRVIDHEVNGHDRVNAGRVAAQPRHRRAQRGKVDHAGHTGEVLQDHTGGLVRDLLLAGAGPGGKVHDVVAGDLEIVKLPERGLQHNFHRVRQARYVADPLFLQPGDAVDGYRPVGGFQRLACAEGVYGLVLVAHLSSLSVL